MDEKLYDLPDGRVVIGGPYIYSQGFDVVHNRFKVGINTIQPNNEYDREKSFILLEGESSTCFYGFRVPKFEKRHPVYWTPEIEQGVVKALQKEGEKQFPAAGFQGKDTANYIISRVKSEPKILSLDNGKQLVGELSFEIGHTPGRISNFDLIILGLVRDKDGEEKLVQLFKIHDLYPDFWPGSRYNPGYDRNGEFWNKKIETLVIGYVKSLIPFARRPLDEQINGVIGNLKTRTEWSKKCNQHLSILRSIPFDHRDDPRINQAFELIKEVAKAA